MEYAVFEFVPDTTTRHLFTTGPWGPTGQGQNRHMIIELFDNSAMTRPLQISGGEFPRISERLIEGRTYYLRFSGFLGRAANGSITVREQDLNFGDDIEGIIGANGVSTVRFRNSGVPESLFIHNQGGGTLTVTALNSAGDQERTWTLNPGQRQTISGGVIGGVPNEIRYLQFSGTVGVRYSARVERRTFNVTAHHFFDHGYSLFYGEDHIDSRNHIAARQVWASEVLYDLFGIVITTNTPQLFETRADRCRRTTVERNANNTIRPLDQRIGGLENTRYVDSVPQCQGDDCDVPGSSNSNRCTDPLRMLGHLESNRPINDGSVWQIHILWSGHQLDPINFGPPYGTLGNNPFISNSQIRNSQVAMIGRPTDGRDEQDNFTLLHEFGHAFGPFSHCRGEVMCIMRVPSPEWRTDISRRNVEDLFCNACISEILRRLR